MCPLGDMPYPGCHIGMESCQIGMVVIYIYPKCLSLDVWVCVGWRVCYYIHTLGWWPVSWLRTDEQWWGLGNGWLPWESSDYMYGTLRYVCPRFTSYCVRSNCRNLLLWFHHDIGSYTSICIDQGLYSLSGKTSYRKISWSLEAARFGFGLFQLLWNLTGISAAALSRCLSNFRAIRSL